MTKSAPQQADEDMAGAGGLFRTSVLDDTMVNYGVFCGMESEPLFDSGAAPADGTDGLFFNDAPLMQDPECAGVCMPQSYNMLGVATEQPGITPPTAFSAPQDTAPPPLPPAVPPVAAVADAAPAPVPLGAAAPVAAASEKDDAAARAATQPKRISARQRSASFAGTTSAGATPVPRPRRKRQRTTEKGAGAAAGTAGAVAVPIAPADSGTALAATMAATGSARRAASAAALGTDDLRTDGTRKGRMRCTTKRVGRLSGTATPTGTATAAAVAAAGLPASSAPMYGGGYPDVVTKQAKMYEALDRAIGGHIDLTMPSSMEPGILQIYVYLKFVLHINQSSSQTHHTSHLILNSSRVLRHPVRGGRSTTCYQPFLLSLSRTQHRRHSKQARNTTHANTQCTSTR